jgi:hypothetical protein
MKKILFVAMALILGLTSCVKDKKYPGITITDLKYSPAAVTEFTPVTVTANIKCFNSFEAKLYYTINNVTTDVKMNSVGGDVYGATIAAQSDNTTVRFYVEATNDDYTASSASMEYTVGAVQVDYSVLRLNELNGNDKFIEIYNSGTDPINMNGVYIVKDETNQNWTADANVNIEAGGYLLLYSEDVTIEGGPQEGYPENLTFHSGLSAKKNVRIQLFTPAGESIDDFNLVDIDQNGAAYNYPGNQAPASYSVNADEDWYYSDATPGMENVDGENIVLGLEGDVPPTPPTPDYNNLVLNELNGNGGAKYIEFYNKGDFDLSMDGMYLEKDDKELPIWTGDATIIVPAHGYLVLYSEDVLIDHPELEGTDLIFASGLSPKKTLRIALFMPDGTERDLFTRGTTGEWGQTITDVSPMTYSRTPDGGEWKLAEATEGAANPATGDDIPQE